MYATKLSAFNTVRTFASLVLKSQKEIWDVTDSIKIPQGSRKSEGNESLRDFIQTHTILDTLGSAHHFVLVYPQFIMIHWRTWSMSGLVELTIMELKQRRLELTGTEMRTAKIPRARAKQTRLKFAAFAYYPGILPRHITTEKNLTSNHCLELKSLGFSVLKYIVLTFC